MEEVASSRMSKQRHQPSNKWSADQLQALMDVVAELMPNSGAGWKEVCMRMHGINSRRRPCDYKAKYMSVTAKEQIISCQQNNKISKEIYFWYQKGKACQQISDILATINSKAVEVILYRIFGVINKIVSKVVGKKKIRQIKMKDYRLFGFMAEEGVPIQSLDQLQFDCLCWRQLNRPKSQFKKEDPEKYTSMREDLEKKITRFNELLKDYEERYHQVYKLPSGNRQNSERLKEEKTEENRSKAISFMYLKAVSQAPQNFRQAQPIFSDEAISKINSELENSLKTISCRTFDEQELQNTHNPYLHHSHNDNQFSFIYDKGNGQFEQEFFQNFNKAYQKQTLQD